MNSRLSKDTHTKALHCTTKRRTSGTFEKLKNSLYFLIIFYFKYFFKLNKMQHYIPSPDTLLDTLCMQ